MTSRQTAFHELSAQWMLGPMVFLRGDFVGCHVFGRTYRVLGRDSHGLYWLAVEGDPGCRAKLYGRDLFLVHRPKRAQRWRPRP